MSRVHTRSARPWFMTGIGVALLFVLAVAFSMTATARRLLASLPAPDFYTSANR